MTETTAEDSERTRLEQLLHRTHEELSDSEAGSAPTEEIRQVADEIDDIVSSRETDQLVEDAGVTLPDDAEPETIAKAIRQGDQESVAKLQTLLLLRKLASTESEEDRKSILADLREISQQFPGVGSERAEGEERESEESTEASTDDGTDSERQDGDSADDAEGDEQSALFRERLEAELEDAIDEFRGNIDGFREHLRSEEAEDAAEAATDEDAGTADEDAGETHRTNPAERRRFSQGTYSTVPSSSSRFSTVRGKTSGGDR